MSILDDLIRVKTNQQDDDLLKMLDEIPVYEKLSVDEKLKDLKNSEITRAKCPLLAGFIDGNLYETVLADLVSNVYIQVEGHAPAVLETAAEKTLKQQRQFEILQKGVAHVEYLGLEHYDHEIMKDMVTAVFTKEYDSTVTAVIIIKEPDGYTMYHGTYANDKRENVSADTGINNPIIVKGQHGIFTMNTYSILGNNGYRFGCYAMSNIAYDVMIGPNGLLYLLAGDLPVIHEIPWEDRNSLNLVKKDPKEFAAVVTGIIESVV